MSIHPIETRYGREEIRKIFDEQSKLQRMLEVEASLAKAHAGVGNIPQEAADEIKENANTRRVKVERVKEIEEETHHDVMAVVKALREKCGDSGRYVHLGATSNDITDTALALQLGDFMEFLLEDVEKLKKALLDKAKQHKETVCIGRTHGQHALPTTYGLKFAIYASEVDRHIQRLKECRERI
ncbi:MAG: hypothetical protein KAU03_00820, partial [Candidatus Altiarchaeales archaeon]|nr:hypothetical protein [Candidatus Altiarchaeales archaeon]